MPAAAEILVRVTPNARASGCAGLMDDRATWKIRLAAPAVDGKANAALVAWLAELFHLPKSAVRIVRGTSSRSKRIAVQGVDPEAAWRLLSEAAADS